MTVLSGLQVVLNTLCAMFSEYCSKPFVTEPVEVVDAFGQSTCAQLGAAARHRQPCRVADAPDECLQLTVSDSTAPYSYPPAGALCICSVPRPQLSGDGGPRGCRQQQPGHAAARSAGARPPAAPASCTMRLGSGVTHYTRSQMACMGCFQHAQQDGERQTRQKLVLCL
jgi:hypothetical protein